MIGRDWKNWNRDGAKGSAPSSFAHPPTWNDLPPDCARHAPLLTALFDGEASDAQVQRARQHLLSCERCARSWLAWHQTRALLGEQFAPAAPQELTEQLRAALAIAQAAPDLQAPILARTSRSNRVAKGKGASLPLAARVWGARIPTSSATLWSATALCAFVLLLARGSLLPAPSPLTPRDDVTIAASSTQGEPRVTAREVADDSRVLPLEAPASSAPMATRSPTSSVKWDVSSASASERTLRLAQRERTGLDAAFMPEARIAPRELAPLQPQIVLASYAPRMETEVPKRGNFRMQAGLRATFRPQSSAQVALRVTSRRVLLASARVSEAPIVAAEVAPDTAPSAEVALPSSTRHGGFLLTLAPIERAPLRISKPRIRPLTFRRDANLSDVGLEDLDSTVQAYRATLSDDADAGTG